MNLIKNTNHSAFATCITLIIDTAITVYNYAHDPQLLPFV